MKLDNLTLLIPAKEDADCLFYVLNELKNFDVEPAGLLILVVTSSNATLLRSEARSKNIQKLTHMAALSITMIIATIAADHTREGKLYE